MGLTKGRKVQHYLVAPTTGASEGHPFLSVRWPHKDCTSAWKPSRDLISIVNFKNDSPVPPRKWKPSVPDAVATYHVISRKGLVIPNPSLSGSMQ